MSLDELVKKEARNSGISQKNADKAIKMLKSGKISINDIAPQLKETLMKQNNEQITDPYIKLRNKLQGFQRSRRSEYAKKAEYDKKAQEIKAEQEAKKQEADKHEVSNKNKKKRQKKKMQKLSEHYGQITEEEYLDLQKQNTNTSLDDATRNIITQKIQLYQYQNKFSTEISVGDFDEFDELLNDNDNTNTIDLNGN